MTEAEKKRMADEVLGGQAEDLLPGPEAGKREETRRNSVRPFWDHPHHFSTLFRLSAPVIGGFFIAGRPGNPSVLPFVGLWPHTLLHKGWGKCGEMPILGGGKEKGRRNSLPRRPFHQLGNKDLNLD